MLKCCTTGPLGTEYFSTGGGTFVTVTGGLLRRTFGRVIGGAFNKELLLTCKVAAAEAGPELAEAPVLVVSSSSSITIGCSVSAIVASEEVASPCTVRGRSHGEALKNLTNSLDGDCWCIRATRLDEVTLFW